MVTFNCRLHGAIIEFSLNLIAMLVLNKAVFLCSKEHVRLRYLGFHWKLTIIFLLTVFLLSSHEPQKCLSCHLANMDITLCVIYKKKYHFISYMFNNVNDSLIHQFKSQPVNKTLYHLLNLSPGHNYLKNTASVKKNGYVNIETSSAFQRNQGDFQKDCFFKGWIGEI